jgi:hypothetical protein
MEYKNFKSASGELVHLSSLSGHQVVLCNEFREVPDCLWALAYSLGALSEDMQVTSVKNHLEEKRLEAEAKEAEERAVFKEKMQKAYLEPATYLDAKGKLIQRKVIHLLNSPIKRDLMDSIWAEIVEENEGK